MGLVATSMSLLMLDCNTLSTLLEPYCASVTRLCGIQLTSLQSSWWHGALECRQRRIAGGKFCLQASAVNLMRVKMTRGRMGNWKKHHSSSKVSHSLERGWL
ncbi:hypothetical protein EDB81DRAFT_808825 [Dactylonectria macrodidyma]|uniref:Secreted protein n=1 Tax=Dactylonectria macrodidyma TaxID=307937 RepID=A0A9P9E3C2_9HYPO|nr:hypothetical protein EDB81DRAFT_808825 [Dactylonectria macrodidyma]